MKPSFHAHLINGPFEDPGLYVRVLRERRALMFDLGSTGNLSSRDILKISHIFVSHMHIDHFIGFDNVLRVCLKRDHMLHLFGPQGIIDCVEGKLNSYTWNLIEGYPLVITVSEVTETRIVDAVFEAGNAFKRRESGFRPFNGVLLEEPAVKVSAAILDHRIPTLGFCLEEDRHINIDKAKLRGLNLPVGPWLKDLKAAIRANESGRDFLINGKRHTFSEVRDVANITTGWKISYIVDAVGSEENLEKITRLVQSSDVLYIETYFLDEDRDRAKDRCHLTAMEAGRIAREAEAGRIEAVHISLKYIDEPERPIQEAENEFRG